MAEDKKSFLLYADLLKSIDHLTNEEKGVLFTHLLEYVNDKNPVLEDRLILTAWKPIELQLKRDLNKYEKTKEEKSISGRIGNIKRYHLDIYKMFEAEEITLEKAEELAKSRKPSHSEKTVAKLAVNDNDTDTVNDTVIVNDIKNIDIPPTAKEKSFKVLTEKEFGKSLEMFIPEFGKQTIRSFFDYWTEKSPTGKMKFQLGKTWDSKKRLKTWKSNEPKFGTEPTKQVKNNNVPLGPWNV